jgi:hypothetical protein
MATIELDSRTAEQLNDLAAAKGMTIDAYLRSLLPPPVNGVAPRLTLVELDALLIENSFDGPTLPADFSRADIYNGHD